ncbi:flagellar hook assembly protein FlgD [Shewanella sp. KT0246]|uniref:flagellar hook assembly protein FlgD n=1 Tax=Shewanella sp. KT0246 TaxID=2815912 RepID=UPI001BB8B89F|nr:flagellar hook assembly protein FlgD [Shewanella sp. KT0246]GIU53320.1 basal-body rod modification protein FlgD [Shewanella sp. KT0246]
MSLVNPYSSQSLPQTQSASSTGIASNTTQTETSSNAYLDSVQHAEAAETPEPNSQELTQSDFFALLSQQLSMQDPFKPVENDQMISQMASFSTVDGIAKLNEEILNLNTLTSSSQALQASGLVGQKVLIPSDTGHIGTDSSEVKGVISTPTPIDRITVNIEDETGQVIRTFEVDGSAGGNIDVTWDGLDKNGEPVAEGNYAIKANGKIDGTSEDLAVSTYAHVSSVSLGDVTTGAILNLRGIGGIQLSDVLAVAES